MVRLLLLRSRRVLRRAGVALAGGAVLLLGLALIPLPGPGLLVVPLGLGILALEFAWARRCLRAVRQRAGAWWRGPQRARDSVVRTLRWPGRL